MYSAILPENSSGNVEISRKRPGWEWDKRKRPPSLAAVYLFMNKNQWIDFYLKSGVADGTRTRDNRNHNPGLYQLSYSHHCLTTANTVMLVQH
jgi:hypothetical protein